jgi:Transposase
MLADQLDYNVGVDPHRDSHALAVVRVISGAVVFESTVIANSVGYAEALALVEEHTRGRRAFAIEGTGSCGAGLTRFLTARGERVLEVSRLRRERRSGGKTDALDAIRAARSVLAQQRPATPRAGGERQALQALVAAREGAVNAKRAGLCQLRDLLITTPEPLRSELRPLTRARLLQRLAATRPHGRQDAGLRGSLLALRSIPRRVLQLTAEERELAREIETLTRKLAPQLLDQPRRRTPRSRTARPLLVTPRTDRLRSRLRAARRRSTDPRLLRANDPLPPRPSRRPQTQPCTAHDPRHTETHTPRHDRLHRTTCARRQNPGRSNPLPQALPRPQPLSPARTRTANDRLMP